MLVLRTVCTTDWKGRPDHSVVLVARAEDRESAKAAMDKDILKWMVVDIASQEVVACDEDDEPDFLDLVGLGPAARLVRDRLRRLDENWESDRASSLLITETPDVIEKMWADTGEARWEMQTQDEFSRKFVENIGDSDICTTVYHLLTDDLEPVLD